MKPKRKGTKPQPKKVFDVMRPGKTAASATSRPVIVGHKPQFKDPMMSERLDDEHLPPEPTSASTQAPPTQPATPEAVATVALADTVAPPTDNVDAETHVKQAEQPTAPPEPTATPPEPAVTPNQPSTEVVHAVTHPSAPGNTGVIFEEMPLDAAAPSSNATEPTEPLPSLPEEQPPMQQAHVFVSHHAARKGGVKSILIIVVLLIIAAIAIDVLLDIGMLSLSGIPHTNFL